MQTTPGRKDLGRRVPIYPGGSGDPQDRKRRRDPGGERQRGSPCQQPGAIGLVVVSMLTQCYDWVENHDYWDAAICLFRSD